MADEDEAATFRFTVTREGATNGTTGPKTFTLKSGAETPVRIGRAPGNDIIVDSRGVSQYHTEIRYLRLDGDAGPSLCVRDLSMNGSGLKRPDGKGPVTLDKRADTPLPDGSVLLVPMLLKVSQASQDRAWLRVDFGGSDKATEVPAPAAARSSRRNRDATAQAAPPATGNGNAGNSEEDIEKCRMRFVELLLKTREVSAGSTYEDAKQLLSTSADWHAVDESTRKECFEIFVEHLASHQNQKKKEKKKGKDKDKDKSKKQKHRDEEEPAAHKEGHYAGASDAKAARGDEKKQRRDRRGGSRSGSPDRKRKREKKGTGRRSRSRDQRSASPGGSPPKKRRHRDRRSGSP